MVYRAPSHQRGTPVSADVEMCHELGQDADVCFLCVCSLVNNLLALASQLYLLICLSPESTTSSNDFSAICGTTLRKPYLHLPTAPFVILLQMKTFVQSTILRNFISDCVKIVDDEVVPAAEAPPAE